jgi:site-specific DNA-cytosine methylase
MLVLSLFPGIGLLDMAFELEGFCVVRGPDVLWGGDIRNFHPPAGKFDGVIGGPPCQSFSSLVHLVRANGHEPKFGNLIPEFERCVGECEPDWFVMENVPQAPEPVIAGYGVKSFLLDNSALNDGDGFGLEQRRVRRFTFGLRGREATNLLRWIDLATFYLPDATGTLSQWSPDNSKEAKTRKQAVTATSSMNAGCLGATKESKERLTRHSPITAGHMNGDALTARKRTRKVTVTSTDGGERPSEKKVRLKAVSGRNGGNGDGELGRNTPGAGNNGKGRYKFPDACRLQGLPEDFLSDAPFTAEGKLKAVANGVPLPMGRAIARAVKDAMAREAKP